MAEQSASNGNSAAAAAMTARISTQLRECVQAAFPCASEQYLTIGIPGQVIDTSVGGSFISPPDVRPSVDRQNEVRVNEAILVDSMVPLSKVMLGPTGKSVTRSYYQALGAMIPRKTDIGTTDINMEDPEETITRYGKAMHFLRAPLPAGRPRLQEKPNKASEQMSKAVRDHLGETVVDRYIARQIAWAQARGNWDEARNVAAEARASGIPELQTAAAFTQRQRNIRKAQSELHAKWMDWVVNGDKFRVDHAFAIVDRDSIMSRIEAAKEATRDSMIMSIDGTDWAAVRLEPQNWATLCYEKANDFSKRYADDPEALQLKIESLRRMKRAYGVYEVNMETRGSPLLVKLVKSRNELKGAQAKFNAAKDLKDAWKVKGDLQKTPVPATNTEKAPDKPAGGTATTEDPAPGAPTGELTAEQAAAKKAAAEEAAAKEAAAKKAATDEAAAKKAAAEEAAAAIAHQKELNQQLIERLAEQSGLSKGSEPTESEMAKLESQVATARTLKDEDQKAFDSSVKTVLGEVKAEGDKFQEATSALYTLEDEVSKQRAALLSSDSQAQRTQSKVALETASKNLEEGKKKWLEQKESLQLAQTTASIAELEADGKAQLSTNIKAHVEEIDAEISSIQAKLQRMGGHDLGGPSMIVDIDKNGNILHSEASGQKKSASSGDNNAGDVWTKISFSVSAKDDHSSTSESAASGSAHVQAKAFFASVEASSSFSKANKEIQNQMSQCAVTGSFSALLVTIRRPWLHAELFQDFDIDTPGDTLLSPGARQLREWIENDDKDKLSEYGKFPAYPTAFIIAADTVLEFHSTASKSKEMMSALSTDSSIKASYGPWGLSGGASLKTDSKESDQKLSVQDGALKIAFRAPQIIGWVSEMLPQLPRVDSKLGGLAGAPNTFFRVN